MRPAKIQISLRIRAVWSESSLGAFCIAGDVGFLYVDNEHWLDYADAQADFSLRQTHISEGISTKTRLYKYIENFATKNRKFSDKNSDIFHISA